MTYYYPGDDFLARRGKIRRTKMKEGAQLARRAEMD
ncbi:hypothetical protein dsat_0770 [Alkalidesulfovibrio alkalitolerans DSM 16529]|jgi:hypothetical protein|uniref:Uncharacterized protein n=1 Tax=Alkalidesulfovibrio alkalitolerans DSM 16529 TaxID=1121439 RepID=S7UJD7_9BACT|nr:hypothetical protein dsat_0770 [Alkalidesulfovibrio alkalitolerans DSM 16529]